MKAAIIGIGETEYTRGTAASEKQLLLQSALAACDDAGIEPKDIDGLITTYKPQIDATEFVSTLAINDLRFHSHIGMGGASAVAAVVQAAAIVHSGLAERVVVVTGWKAFSGDIRLGAADNEKLAERPGRPNLGIRRNLEAPYGLIVPMQHYGLQANRWLCEDEKGRAAMETVALTSRTHAHLNEKALMRGRPLTADMYRQSPVLVEPFHLYDICLESDGAAAVLVGKPAGARDTTSHRPVHILAGGQGHSEQPDDIANRTDITEFGLWKAANHVFGKAGIDRRDIQFAQVYDCFTFVVLRQLELLGFCQRGEVGEFVANGSIGIGGRLPVNTHGGLHSQAHVQGMNHVVEAVKQLRGQAGVAQIPGVQIGLVTGYGMFCDGSLAVLSN